MSTVRHIDEDELPLDADEFTDRFIAEVDEYIATSGRYDSQFDRPATEEEMVTGLYTRIYNELMAVKHPFEMLEDVEDPDIYIQLLKQIEDEARHARLLAQRLRDLGGDPSKTNEHVKDQALEMWSHLEGLDVVERTVLFQCGGERGVATRHENESAFYDDETQRVYEDVIIPDEKFHTQVGVNIVRRYCTDGDSQRRALQKSREGRKLFGRASGGVYATEEGG